MKLTTEEKVEMLISLRRQEEDYVETITRLRTTKWKEASESAEYWESKLKLLRSAIEKLENLKTLR
jgi:hypothetical protein